MKKSPLLIIFLVVFIDLVGFGIVIPILPYYAKQYGASAFALGMLMMVYSLLQMLMAPFWGKLSDSIGRRPVLLMSMMGSTLSLAVLGWAPSLIWLFAARSFSGICGANISTATAYIADVTTPEKRAKGMGLIGAAFGLGFIFGPALGGVLSRYGYSVPMYAAAVLSGANVLFAFVRLKEPERIVHEDEGGHATRRFDLASWRDAMGNESSRRAILIFFLATLGMTQMEVTFALFLLARFHFDAHIAGWMLAFLGVIMVIIQGGLIGRLSKNFGEQKLALAGTIVMATSMFLLGESMTVPLVMLALGLLAAGNGVLNPSLTSIASKGARASKRGLVMGVYQSAGSLARVLGPPVGGFVFDHFGPSKPFWVASALLFLGFAGAMRLRKSQV